MTTTSPSSAVMSVQSMEPAEIAQQIGTVAPDSVLTKIPAEVEDKVLRALEDIASIGERDIDKRNEWSDKARSFGRGVREKVAHRSDLLNAPVKDIMGSNGQEGDLAVGLLNLRKQVEMINPNGFDFSESGFRRLLAKLPGIGSKLEAWWSQYQSVAVVIEDILNNLRSGAKKLERDNEVLKRDTDELLKATWELTDALQVAMLLDQKLLEWTTTAEAPAKKFVEEEVLYYLRQEVQDMQLSLGATNQAIMVATIIRKANEELIRSTERTLNVSAQALATAASLEIALSHQKRQADARKAVDDMTVELMKGTAAKAKTQGVEIIKSANDVSAFIDGLKSAFADSIEAMNLLEQYKQDALPAMASNISVLEQANKEMKQHIEKAIN